jgi:hypothetical protein
MDQVATVEAIRILRRSLKEIAEDPLGTSVVVEMLKNAQMNLQADLYYYMHDTTKASVEAKHREVSKKEQEEINGLMKDSGKKETVN